MKNIPTGNYNNWFSELFNPVGDTNRMTQHWHNHSVLYLMEETNKEDIEKVRFYIDYGDGSYRYEGTPMIHITLKKKEIEQQYRVRDGTHSWEYWRTGLTNGLTFISQSFHR